MFWILAGLIYIIYKLAKEASQENYATLYMNCSDINLMRQNELELYAVENHSKLCDIYGKKVNLFEDGAVQKIIREIAKREGWHYIDKKNDPRYLRAIGRPASEWKPLMRAQKWEIEQRIYLYNRMITKKRLCERHENFLNGTNKQH